MENIGQIPTIIESGEPLAMDFELNLMPSNVRNHELPINFKQQAKIAQKIANIEMN